MARSTRKSRSSDTCVVRIISTGEDGPFDVACGRAAEFVMGTAPMCEMHAGALKRKDPHPPPGRSAEDVQRSSASLLEAQRNVVKLPVEARAEARAGRADENFCPRVEVDAGWLAGMWSQLELTNR
ncbi:MAG TPA: hypothetical protein VEJ87_15135 [Acidimicrobiales bacterium]|nr:hypothetical protein [Acidimicrobiales bacterium]